MTATSELHELESGQLLRTHAATADCAQRFCTIHNPSAHPLHQAPRLWDPNISIVLRICPDGIGHPDPDDLRVRDSVDPMIECICECGCCGFSQALGKIR